MIVYTQVLSFLIINVRYSKTFTYQASMSSLGGCGPGGQAAEDFSFKGPISFVLLLLLIYFFLTSYNLNY